MTFPMGAVPPVLSVPGMAADHLYREGSAKASFWEVLFGSRLAPEKRTRVSSLADGTRRFDVPIASVEDQILANARAWMAAQRDEPWAKQALAALESSHLRLSLVGLQPRGVAVASFDLLLEPTSAQTPAAGLSIAFQRWFAAEQQTLNAILVPFGFTPLEPAP